MALVGTWKEMGVEKKIMKILQGKNGTPFLALPPECRKTCITWDTTSLNRVNDDKWHGEKKFLRTVP